MVHIYNKNLKYLIGLNYNFNDFIKKPFIYYPEWKDDYYATDKKYEYPFLDNGKIREMTIKEKILNLGMKEFLEAGEYIENGELITIDYPDDGNMYDWDGKKWVLNIEKTVEKKEVELNNIRLKMKSIIDEIEYSKNYGLYTTYTVDDLNTLKEKEFNLSLEIAMLRGYFLLIQIMTSATITIIVSPSIFRFSIIINTLAPP